jgi:Cytochrome c554 and c-prime
MKKYTFAVILLILMLFSLRYYFEKNSVAKTTQIEDINPTTMQGRVMSVYGPVQNARVRIPGDAKYTLTNRQGQYMLQPAHVHFQGVKITAGKEGWFNNAQFAGPLDRVPDIYLNPIYLNDHPDYRFISPVTCSRCHTTLTRYWDQSKMAHTTSNPKVLDMYYGTDAFQHHDVGPGYRLDNPNSNGNCAVCHAPSAVASSPWSQDLKSVLQSPRTEWDGISCDYCHKIDKVFADNTKPSRMAPIFERQSSPIGNSILVFGPYDDVVVPPMAASYSSVFNKGEFCAVCHGHFKPLGKGKIWDHSKIYSASEWKGFGLKDDTVLPIQTTFQEWKNWQDGLARDDPNKGKKCQDCHMSWRKEMLPYDNYVVDGAARNMWGTYRSPENIHPHHFDGGTQTQLKTALSMEIDGKTTGKKVDIHVYITNTNGGHWVPTGETMRSIMLVLNVVDSKGKPLKMVKGERLPKWTGKGKIEAGNYAGLPGSVFARVLKDDKGHLNVPFWRATGIASDTRIRPKTTVTLSYEFLLENPEDEPTAKAKLIYRPVIRPWVKSKKWPAKDILITSRVW